MPADADDDTLLLEPPGVAVEGEGDPVLPAEGEQTTAVEGDDDDEVIVTLGGEEPPADEEDPARAPDWVRELRKANREKDRRIRELEQRVAVAAPAPAAVVVGEKPTLAACEYDEAKFETELAAWQERKRKVEDDQRQREDAAKKDQESWQARLAAHSKAAAALKVQDFEDAQDAARETFSIVQQGIMLKGINDADTAAKLIYALGKNPKKAKELAAITDPIQFAVAIGEVKTMLKTAPRKSAPVPDRVVRGNSGVALSSDANLAKLEAEAERTGNRTKVIEYKRQLKLKQK